MAEPFLGVGLPPVPPPPVKMLFSCTAPRSLLSVADPTRPLPPPSAALAPPNLPVGEPFPVQREDLSDLEGAQICTHAGSVSAVGINYSSQAAADVHQSRTAICPLAHKGVVSLRIQRVRADGLGHGLQCGGACGMAWHGTAIMPL